MDVLRVAVKKDKNSESYQRAGAGGENPVVVDIDCVWPAELLRSPITTRMRADRSAAEHWRKRDEHQYRRGGIPRLRATSALAETSTPTRCKRVGFELRGRRAGLKEGRFAAQRDDEQKQQIFAQRLRHSDPGNSEDV